MSNNDLNQIRIFNKVAEFQSFTKAAEALEVEKSTVSLKISQLEQRLGVRLLNRTTRSVKLTHAGHQYLSYCQAALQALKEGDDFIAGVHDVPQGHLKVNMPADLVNFILPTVITPFLLEHPEVSLEILQYMTPLDLIQEGVDLEIRSINNAITDSSLIYRKIYQSDWLLVASEKHVATHGLAESPLALANQPSVGMQNTANESFLTEQLHWQGQRIELNHRLTVASSEAIKQAAVQGLGFAMLPSKMVQPELNDGRLVDITQDIEIQPSSLFVIYPSRRGQPASVRAFLAALINWGDMMSVS